MIHRKAAAWGMLKAENYPAEKREFLLRLMSLFHLSYPLDDMGREHRIISALARTLRILLKARLPMPEVQSDLYDDAGELIGRADLYYPQARLVIEYDGGNHRDRLVSDNRRQNSLIRAGYRMLRFTAPDVYGRPQAVANEVRGYLSGR